MELFPSALKLGVAFAHGFGGLGSSCCGLGLVRELLAAEFLIRSKM